MAWLLVTVFVADRFPDFYRRVPHCLVILGGITAVVTLVVYFHQHGMSFERMQGLGVLKNSLVAAQTFGAIGVMAFVMWFEKNNHSFWDIECLVFIICSAAVFFTQSRGPILYLIVAVLGLSVILKASRKQLVLLLLAPLLIVVFMSLRDGSLGSSLGRLTSIDSPRFQVWEIIFEGVKQQPWLGQGVVRFTDFQVTEKISLQHSHNVFLDTLRFGGVVGLVLLIVHFYLAVRDWKKNKVAHPFYGWLLFGLFCMLTNGKFLLVRPDWIWICYWVPVGFICAASRKSHLARE